jgi:phage tail-like protein
LAALGLGIHSARFSDVKGLDLSISPVVYRDGFSFITGPTIMAGKEEEVKLTLSRGIIQKDSFLYEWLADTRSLLTQGKRDLHITLCNEQGFGVVHWNVKGAMPTKLSGPDLNAQSQEIAIETLELTAASLRLEFTS